MSILLTIGHFVMEDEVSVDSEGIVTHSPFLPEIAEIIYGGLASIIIFAFAVQVRRTGGQEGPLGSHREDPERTRQRCLGQGLGHCRSREHPSGQG